MVAVDIYKYFAKSRDFGFKDQITRASLSIPSNIAEGAERRSDKETRHFFNIAKSSCAELYTQVYVGIEIGYVDAEFGEKLMRELDELSAMLSSLIKRLSISEKA